MYKIFAVIAVALSLVGCQTTDAELLKAAIKNQTVVVTPPEAMYECPDKPKPPSSKGLTDAKVARYIVRLDRAHSICFNSIDALKDYISKARQRIEQDNR